MKITINDFVWRVLLDSLKNVNTLGYTDPQEFEIRLDKDMHRQNVRVTIIHELTHAFLYSYGIVSNQENYYFEEQICDFVGLYAPKILELAAKIEKELYHGDPAVDSAIKK